VAFLGVERFIGFLRIPPERLLRKRGAASAGVVGWRRRAKQKPARCCDSTLTGFTRAGMGKIEE